MNKRSFLKRVGLLAGLAVLNPLKALGLFKDRTALSMETMKAAFEECRLKEGQDYLYFSTPEPTEGIYIGPKEPYYWYRGTFNQDVSGEVKDLSHFDGKQWIPVED